MPPGRYTDLFFRTLLIRAKWAGSRDDEGPFTLLTLSELISRPVSRRGTDALQMEELVGSEMESSLEVLPEGAVGCRFALV